MSAKCDERLLRMRFGIGTNTDRTLEKVGQQFSVNRERIREGAKEAEASERQLDAAEFLG